VEKLGQDPTLLTADGGPESRQAPSLFSGGRPYYLVANFAGSLLL
jgi:hypothetical protein